MSQKNCRNSDSRMKPRKTGAVVAGAAAFVVVFCMLTALTVCLAPPDYLLSRIEINPSYGDGYTMPETLEREIWTSMISTEYEDGAKTGQTVYRRAIGGDYTAEIVLPEEDSETLRGIVTGKEVRCDIQAAADGGFWENSSLRFRMRTCGIITCMILMRAAAWRRSAFLMRRKSARSSAA